MEDRPYQVFTRIDRKTRDRWEKLVRRNRRTSAEEFRIAIEEHLERGLDQPALGGTQRKERAA